MLILPMGMLFMNITPGIQKLLKGLDAFSKCKSIFFQNKQKTHKYTDVM
jgi:hypothetical protein